MKLLFALLGAAVVAHSTLLPTKPFNSGKHYIYTYNGAIFSGLPVSDAEGSLTRIQAEIDVHFMTDRSAVMQLKKIRISAAHSSTEDILISMDSLEQRELSKDHERILHLPVAFDYKSGLVSEIQFSENEEKPWSANIKRAILNMLQLNQNQPTEDEGREAYAAPEKTIEGECEVIYNMLETHGKKQITKTVNFEKCSRDVQAVYGRRFAKKTDNHQIVAPLTVYTYTIENNQIKEIEVNSKYNMMFKDESFMKTEVQARLTLNEVKENGDNIQPPTGRKQELLYSNEYELAVEKFFKSGEKIVRNPFSEFTAKVERGMEILEKIKEIKENDPEMVHQMARLVRVFRMCSSEDLEHFHERLFKTIEDKRIKMIIQHGLAIAGTKNTIEHLLNHIKDQEVTPLKAVQLFKSIQETHYPSEQIAELVKKFIQNGDMHEQPAVHQAAWLCYGAIIRGVVAHNGEKHLFDENHSEIKNKFLDVLEDNYDHAAEVYEKIIALKVIANSGLDIAVRKLEKVIRDTREPVIVRVEAIQALRIISQKMGKKIHRILMPIFSDRKERTELRAAAFERLIYTIPEPSVVIQMVNVIEKDPNHHFANYVYSFLKGIEETNFPTEAEFVSQLRAIISRSTFRPTTLSSFYRHFPMYSKEWVTGGHININAIFGKDSIIPKDMAIDLETMTVGRWNQYLGQMGISHQNIEELVNIVYKKLSKEFSLNEEVQRRIQEGESIVKSISKKMNIRIRKDSAETPFAMLYFRYKQMDYAVLPVDKQMIHRFIQEYLENGKVDLQMIDKITGETVFDTTNAAFLFETTNRLPTTIGLPLTVTGKMPTIVTTSGKVVMNRVSYGLQLRLQGKPIAVSSIIYQMRIWTPALEHGVKIVRPTKLALPLNVDIDVTARTGLGLKLNVEIPEEKTVILTTSSQPIAFLRFPSPSDINKFIEIEENTIVIPGWQRRVQPVDKKIVIGGVEMAIGGNGYKKWTPKEHLYGEHNYFISVERKNSDVKEWTLETEITYDSDKQLVKPELSNIDQPKMEKEESIRSLVEDVKREVRRGYSFDVSGSLTSDKKITFHTLGNMDKSMRFCRIKADLSVPNEDERSWTWEFKGEKYLSRPVNSIAELLEKEDNMGYLITAMKWGAEDRNEVVTKVVLEQSPEMRNWIRSVEKQMRERPDMEEFEILEKARSLNKLRINSKFSVNRQSRHYFESALDMLHAYGFWSSKMERIEGKQHHVEAVVVIEPATGRYVNFTIQTPEIRLKESIWSPVRVPMINLASVSKLSWSSAKNVLSREAECKLTDKKISTFDNVEYRAPLTKCYSLFAKDCSEQARYAVFVKKDESNKKSVKVMQGNDKFIFEVIRDKMRITKNEKLLSEEKYEQDKIEMTGKTTTSMEMMNANDVIVRFDGENVKVIVSTSQMNTVCGLCGHFNGDKSDVFRKANGESTEDLEDFHRSYLLKDQECEVEEDKISQKKQYKLFEYDEEQQEEQEYRENYYEQPRSESRHDSRRESKDLLKKTIRDKMRKAESSNNQSQEDDETVEIEPRKENIISERGSIVCISTEPQPQCPKHSRPLKEKEQKVKIACFRRSDVEARELLKDLKQQPRSFSAKRSVATEPMKIPTMCVAY